MSATNMGPKLLYRRLDRLFAGLDLSLPAPRVLPLFLDELQRSLGEDLRIAGASLFDEHRDGFELVHVCGDPGCVPGDDLAHADPVVARLLVERSVVYAEPAADACPDAFPGAPCAGIVVGQAPRRHAFFFRLLPGWSHDEIAFALNTVRVALGARLVDERVRGSFQQAAEIQQSLLLDAAPPFPGYDIACRSLPADEVGGDFYDFMDFDTEMLGVAIGDASGHGLPAALLVRDVVTGLRMGIEREMKVGYVFRKLNRVIHRSRLTSRFISVFYGELEGNGNLIYVNAGHPPPLLFLKERLVELTTGGTVIGPLPEVRFKRGFAHLDRGSLLLLYSDGIIERQDAAGDMVGKERLVEWVRDAMTASAEKVLEHILERVRAFGQDRPFEDDATLVVVKRLP